MANMKIQSHCLLLSILLIAFFSNVKITKAEVITLTADTFSDKVKEKDTVWFVQFCVPWCKHCKNLGSLWEDLGKMMEGEDEIEIGQVDCGVSKSVCTKVDIHSYPTFKVFYDGEEVAKYQATVKKPKLKIESVPKALETGTEPGQRNVESLKTFVLEEAEKAATKAELENEKDL